MKFRRGFVSNSSSCSFLISLDALYPLQIELIQNHKKVTEWLVENSLMSPDDKCEAGEEWNITVDRDKNELRASTNMDNFDLLHFMNSLGIDDRFIHREDSH